MKKWEEQEKQTNIPYGPFYANDNEQLTMLMPNVFLCQQLGEAP